MARSIRNKTPADSVQVVTTGGYAPGVHVAGTGATEIRRIAIAPNSLMIDDDAAKSTVVVLDHGTTGPISDVSRRGTKFRTAGGVKLTSNKAEGYVYFTLPSDGWDATAVKLHLTNAADGSPVDRLVAVSSRTAETQTSFESTHRLHVQNATTNTLVTLTPQYRQTSENYMVIYLGVGASDDVFTGGFVEITPR